MSTRRAVFRLLWLLGEIGLALGRSFAAPSRADPASRARWMQATARRFLHVLGCTVHVEGTPPSGGLIVANHLGYLDVLVLGATCPAVFVAKAEVRKWPVFGALATRAGTLFLDRERRTAVGPIVAAMQGRIAAGCVVVVFPEGTSSDGTTVLPFRSALLAAATGAPVTPAALGYALPGGSVPEEVCYWSDMVFAPHLWNLLGKAGLTAHLRFGRPRRGGRRKEAARTLQAAVARLRGEINAKKTLGPAECGR